jgi:rhodanese-related sulfurtransferase
MEQYIEFIINHWEMVTALLLMIALLLITEQRKSGAAVSPQHATLMVNSDNAVLLDLRTTSDFKAGRIINSFNIPFAELSKRLGDLEKYKGKPIILVCKTGQTTGSAGRLLKKSGFQQVVRMAGGITEWSNQNLPMVRK